VSKTVHTMRGEEARHVPFARVWRGFAKLRARRELRALRAAADIDLARRDRPPLRLSWRVEELVSTKNRLDLAHSLRSLVRDARPSYLPSASPFNRLVVRTESDQLLAVATRLADLERPVAARGVVLLDRLLTDGSGPLYDRERADEFGPTLDAILDGLEPR
jgi:hypothetical protein